MNIALFNEGNRMINAIEKYQEFKDNEQLLIGYQGEITESLTTNLLSLAENKLAMVEYNSRLKKKVFHILVEVLQNIYHNFSNLSEAPKGYMDIFVMVIKTKSSYEIISGNYMLKNQSKTLVNRMTEVNKMGEDLLREEYRKKLDEGVISYQGRAGLGIMDMVRKSGSPLEYDFLSVDKEFSFFSLKVTLKNH
jgi:hypothetical protein